MYHTHWGEGGGGRGGELADSALLQIVIFINAAEPRNLVTFPKI